ncbi:microfibril-associated glycoprotein 4-like [Alosa pseudoharengus]|uniref:microfibril-associated glycoprotein 4-like n=1 Tax=Alosa pseudoharengus TaxID=34774 RepID=UPI003F8A08DB
MRVLVLLLGLVPLSLGSNMYLPLDCADIHSHDSTKPSGVYSIFPGGPISPLQVYCDMETDGGGWTVFQKRMDGSVNFYRPWNHYKKGFGDLTSEYWLGLDNIVLLTMRKRNKLRVDMEDWTGGKAYAHYASISVDPEQLGYTLHLGAFTTGDAGDALKNHNGMKFTTFDKDQDTWDKNCASSFMGGFWYLNCHDANPNGLYIPDSASPHGPVYVSWDTWKGNTYSLKTITMKMRSLSQCSN